MKTTALAVSAATLTVLTLVPALAQQVTGVPGSPSATTTIDGKYLPPQPPKFGGQINLEAATSTPYWPPQIVPPKSAPNILLIMTDDQGYGVSVASFQLLQWIASRTPDYVTHSSTQLLSAHRHGQR
jgi:hypothetical protein